MNYTIIILKVIGYFCNVHCIHNECIIIYCSIYVYRVFDRSRNILIIFYTKQTIVAGHLYRNIFIQYIFLFNSADVEARSCFLNEQEILACTAIISYGLARYTYIILCKSAQLYITDRGFVLLMPG